MHLTTQIIILLLGGTQIGGTQIGGGGGGGGGGVKRTVDCLLLLAFPHEHWKSDRLFRFGANRAFQTIASGYGQRKRRHSTRVLCDTSPYETPTCAEQFLEVFASRSAISCKTLVIFNMCLIINA